MPTTSTKRLLRAPLTLESPDVPRDIGFLVADLEAEVGHVATRDVLEVGIVGQTRAGRALVPADFTDLGLVAPTALYGLADVNDTSGAGLNLTNKGAVPFGVGIEGAAASAAVFAGSTAQAFYRADTGGADPLRQMFGTFGFWLKTARVVGQAILSKMDAGGANRAYHFALDGNGYLVVQLNLGSGGATVDHSLGGSTFLADDLWHFVAVTYDPGLLRIYVDGKLDAEALYTGTQVGFITQTAATFNVGGYGATAGANSNEPFYGRLDEVFLTQDVLNEEQVRNLMAVKVAHGAGRTPRRASVGVRRRRRGVHAAVADFPVQPQHYHPLERRSQSPIYDLGSLAIALTSAGAWWSVPGPDGQRAGGVRFNGAANSWLQATDAGMRDALNDRSFGAWFKVPNVNALQRTIMSWGANVGGQAHHLSVDTDGKLTLSDYSTNLVKSGQRVDDGSWHHAAIVVVNAAADGIKMKMYLDGRLVSGTTSITTLVLGGANGYRVGANAAGGAIMYGDVAQPFVVGTPLAREQVAALVNKAGLTLGLSPKNEGDHVEKVDATHLYFLGDTLDPADQVNLEVAA